MSLSIRLVRYDIAAVQYYSTIKNNVDLCSLTKTPVTCLVKKASCKSGVQYFHEIIDTSILLCMHRILSRMFTRLIGVTNFV